jgi:hypothetical protein
MPPAGAKVTPVPQSVIQRAMSAAVSGAAGAVAGAIKGVNEAWFSPLQPIAPVAPPDVRGRVFDYSTGFNLPYKARTESGQQGIDHETLRALADPTMGGFDLVRLAVETCKDRISAEEWCIRERGKGKGDGGPRARAIEEALRHPDGEHTYLQWQRMLYEDLLVIDAPTVYLSPPTEGGTDRVPEVMDGALLKPLLRPDGRSPVSPEPAYVQILKGVPAVWYSRDEIVRMPRNLRSYRVYGMSPVEQIVVTINIALRRQVSQLEFYTAGSIPDMLASVPQGWTTKQIQEFQTYWDALLSGNTEERRRLRFVPGDMKPYEPKAGQLKDTFDEWLSRIVCYAFNLSPQALVQQMNRATAETAKASAAEEGLEPFKLSWRDLMNEIVVKGFNEPGLEFAYIDEEITDPSTKAGVVTSLVTAKVITQDEARAKYGFAPLTPEQRAELNPPVPEPEIPAGQLDLFSADGGDEANAGKAAKASLRKAGRSLQGAQARSAAHPQGCRCHPSRYP